MEDAENWTNKMKNNKNDGKAIDPLQSSYTRQHTTTTFAKQVQPGFRRRPRPNAVSSPPDPGPNAKREKNLEVACFSPVSLGYAI